MLALIEPPPQALKITVNETTMAATAALVHTDKPVGPPLGRLVAGQSTWVAYRFCTKPLAGRLAQDFAHLSYTEGKRLSTANPQVTIRRLI